MAVSQILGYKPYVCCGHAGNLCSALGSKQHLQGLVSQPLCVCTARSTKCGLPITSMLANKRHRGQFVSHVPGVATTKPSQTGICMQVHHLALLPTAPCPCQSHARVHANSLGAPRAKSGPLSCPCSLYLQRYGLSASLPNNQIRGVQLVTSDR